MTEPKTLAEAHALVTAQRRAAGRKGGQATAARGAEHFAAIGRKGGEAVKAHVTDPEHFRKMGAKGAAALRARLGEEAYNARMREVSAKGGEAQRAATRARRKHSRSTQVRCEICAPLRCSEAP